MSVGIDGLVPRIEALVLEEIDLQRRVLANLASQEVALIAADGAGLDELLDQARRLIQETAPREARLRMILKDFERLWGVSAKSLTLGSIATRLEGSGRRLKRLRTELLDVLREVARTGSRVRTFARFQQGIIRETVERVIESEGGKSKDSGSLINAEA